MATATAITLDQWLFLQFLNADLVSQRSHRQWDPIDQTVLANEQVDADGRSWRSGALVEKRKLRQWFEITAVADELLDDLEQLQAGARTYHAGQLDWSFSGATLRFALGFS